MESFRNALDRLTRDFFAEVLAVVRTAAVGQLGKQQKREAKPKPTRIVRSSAPVVPEVRPVVVRTFDIPVGQPRRRRRRVAGSSPAKKAAPPPPPPQVVKFEVVPHPERKNRRIVMTRLDSADSPPPSNNEG